MPRVRQQQPTQRRHESLARVRGEEAVLGESAQQVLFHLGERERSFIIIFHYLSSSSSFIISILALRVRDKGAVLGESAQQVLFHLGGEGGEKYYYELSLSIIMIHHVPSASSSSSFTSILALCVRGKAAVLGEGAQKVLFHLGGAGRRTVTHTYHHLSLHHHHPHVGPWIARRRGCAREKCAKGPVPPRRSGQENRYTHNYHHLSLHHHHPHVGPWIARRRGCVLGRCGEGLVPPREGGSRIIVNH